MWLSIWAQLVVLFGRLWEGQQAGPSWESLATGPEAQKPGPTSCPLGPDNRSKEQMSCCCWHVFPAVMDCVPW